MYIRNVQLINSNINVRFKMTIIGYDKVIVAKQLSNYQLGNIVIKKFCNVVSI